MKNVVSCSWSALRDGHPERRGMSPRIFISYSHQDEAWKDRLVRQLGVLELEGELSLWHDRKSAAGDDWLAEIKKAIASADAAVLLISADFLTSEFIHDEELPALLKRRDEDGLRVIPLIVRPCPWQPRKLRVYEDRKSRV